MFSIISLLQRYYKYWNNMWALLFYWNHYICFWIPNEPLNISFVHYERVDRKLFGRVQFKVCEICGFKGGCWSTSMDIEDQFSTASWHHGQLSTGNNGWSMVLDCQDLIHDQPKSFCYDQDDLWVFPRF